MPEALDRSFSVQLACHYLLHTPDRIDERTPLVVTLHGFGGNPESMLKMTHRLFEARPVIAALQGPFQFFLSADAREVGYGWITNRRPAESIRLHHEMVLHVLEEVGSEYGIPEDRRLLAGFSQAVALNYRFAASCPDAIRGVIAICGGLPGDWEDGADQPIRASALHIAARQDEYYPPGITDSYLERLRRHAVDVEFRLIDGDHRMPSNGAAIVAPWLRRILPT
jgi:phospholipase/carboxylesterase